MGWDWEKQPRDPATGRWMRPPEREPRDRLIMLRMTGEEYRQLTEAARAGGLTYTAVIMAGLEAAGSLSRARPDR